jgi:tetratricopeptide (TPR) repeat protein
MMDDPTVTHVGSEVTRAGKYRIVGLIGQGGMGVVYRGIDDDLGRTVALKFVPAELTNNPSAEQRFLREARAASALDHVNIGTIYGVEETEDHRRFIVMAYYEGQNLSQRMQDDTRPLVADEAIGIAVQVARGLAQAHAAGVIHRDIKPSNILLTQQTIVKVVDFGIASMADAAPLTQDGSRMGTPAYMSPEQALGLATDHRSDIWSLAVMTCEMITRQPVFQSDSVPATLFQVVHGDTPALDFLQPELRAVMSKALAKDPEKRFQSMTDFLTALESLQLAMITPLAKPVRRWKLRKGAVLTVTAVLAIIAVGAYVWRTKPFGAKRPAIAGAPSSATEYDKYSQSVDLIRRWDKEGNLDRAIALLTDATTQDPKFALGFARLAEAQRIKYASTGDKTVLETAAANAAHAVQLNGDLAPVQFVLGRIQSLTGKSELAMASFQLALRIDPNDGEANQAIARQYQMMNRPQDAEKSFRRAVALDPDNTLILDSFAIFLFKQGRFQDAITEWQAEIRLAPDNASALINLGAALSETGKIAEAITTYQRALAIQPNYMAFHNLGTQYFRSVRYPEAAEAYRKSLDLKATDFIVWGDLGYAYSWTPGKEKEAKEAFAKAIELGEGARQANPRDSAVASQLALYYAKSGQPSLALARMDTALALLPKGPDVLASAAEMYELLGRRDKALDAAREAIAVGYSRNRFERNPELTKLLQALRQ